jgi:serine O-acetyltransferase
MKKTFPNKAAARLDELVTELSELYVEDADDRPDGILGGHPRPERIIAALQIFLDILFPGKFSSERVTRRNLPVFLRRSITEGSRLLLHEVERALPLRWHGQAARTEGEIAIDDIALEARRVVEDFCAALPKVRWLVVEDVRAAYAGDPAALTYAEVQLAYPGVLAVASHRLAHELYKLKVPLVPRVMSEWTHAQTGADIHPGAQIGHGFFIDHATGVVIGETTVIGNHVKLYQGVTLGARSFPLDANGNPIKHVKRHPTVEDNVVVYANATILGGDTVVGRGSTVGGNVFIMESIPADSVVTMIHPEHHIKNHKGKGAKHGYTHAGDGI